jgi:hypothetical protein
MQQMFAEGISGRNSFSLAAGIANLNDLRRRNCFDNFSLCTEHATFPSRFRGVFAHAKPTQNNTLYNTTEKVQLLSQKTKAAAAENDVAAIKIHNYKLHIYQSA